MQMHLYALRRAYPWGSNPKLTGHTIRGYHQMQWDFDHLGSVMPRILVVDDDPMVGATIEVLLQRQGFDVTLTDGGFHPVDSSAIAYEVAARVCL